MQRCPFYQARYVLAQVFYAMKLRCLQTQ